MSKRGRSDDLGIIETMSGRRTLNIKDKYIYKQTIENVNKCINDIKASHSL